MQQLETACRDDKKSDKIIKLVCLDVSTKSRAKRIAFSSAVNIDEESGNRLWIATVPVTTPQATRSPSFDPSV